MILFNIQAINTLEYHYFIIDHHQLYIIKLIVIIVVLKLNFNKAKLDLIKLELLQLTGQ